MNRSENAFSDGLLSFFLSGCDVVGVLPPSILVSSVGLSVSQVLGCAAGGGRGGAASYLSRDESGCSSSVFLIGLTNSDIPVLFDPHF